MASLEMFFNEGFVDIFSAGLSGYSLAILGTNISLRSMVWSNGQ